MNEKDYSKTINLKKLNNNHCSYFKLMKSEYMKNSYSKLLLASENNISYHKNLINYTNSTYTKYYYSKLLVQHAELINKHIKKIEELLKIDNNLKHDLLLLHSYEYITYKNALNVLSEIKIFYKNLHKYDIEDQIDILNYKTNLAGIEYLKTKMTNNNMINEAKEIENILNKYKTTHDNNLFDRIIEIEGFTNVKDESNNYFLLFFIFCIVKIFCFFLLL